MEKEEIIKRVLDWDYYHQKTYVKGDSKNVIEKYGRVTTVQHVKVTPPNGAKMTEVYIFDSFQFPAEKWYDFEDWFERWHDMQCSVVKSGIEPFRVVYDDGTINTFELI